MSQRSLWSFLFLSATLQLVGQVPAAFIENRGQWPAQVAFKATLPGAVVWFERNSLLLDHYQGQAIAHGHDARADGTNPTVQHHVLRLRFIGGSGEGRSEGLGVQRGAYHFFQGNDPSRWASGAHAFHAATQHDLYPGIDLRVRITGAQLKYDLLLAPGADATAVAFTYEGADHLALRDGHLIIGTALGELKEHIPMAYQEVDGERRIIACDYVMEKGRVHFALGPHDPAFPIVIDPTLEFCTYSGSTSDNFGYTATYDELGFLYGGSSSFGSGYPTTTGAYQTTWAGGDGQGTPPNDLPGTDIAITKFDTTGGFLIWSTMLGGSGDDLPHSLIVNSADEVLVLGTTGSPNFPVTTNAFDQSFGGGTFFSPIGIGVSYPLGADMIVAKLSADGGELEASTYFGGSLNDGHNSAPALRVNYADEMRGEILLTAEEDVLVVSCTQSNDILTSANAPQPTYAGGSHDGVIARFNADLSALEWCTYIGGSGADAGFNVALDADNSLVVCGGTNSPDLPVSGSAFQTGFAGGQADGFVVRYAPDGASVQALTYYGSGAYDQAYFTDLDQEGNVFLFGQTLAPPNELILNAPWNVPNAGQFIAKLDPALSNLLMGSRFGVGDGTLDISPTAFLVDYCDKLYVCGWGSSGGSLGTSLSTTGMTTTPGAFQIGTDGNDFYLAVFEVDMSDLSYATFFGGGSSLEHVDGGTSRFDRRGRVYGAICAGCGGNDDLPTTPGAWSTINGNSCNLGVFKFDFDAPLVIAQPVAVGPACANAPVQFFNYSQLGAGFVWDFGDDSAPSNAVVPTHVYAEPGTYMVTLTATNPNACNGLDVDSIQVVVQPQAPQLEAMADVSICGPAAQLTLSANSFGTAEHFVWSSNGFFTDTLNLDPSDSTALLAPIVGGTYYVQASTPGSCIAVDQVQISTSLQNIAITPDSAICLTETANLSLTGVDPGSAILWGPEGSGIISGQGTPTLLVQPSASQEYTVQVTSPTGCVWNGSATVSVSDIPAALVSATVDQPIVAPGTTVQLSAQPTDGYSFMWTPANAVSNASIAVPTAFVTQSTTFTVSISDGICTRDASVSVEVRELNCGEPDIYVPDAFTPNGDGNNDALFVRGRWITALEFKLFDRWGSLVFETNDQRTGWDGTYKGEPVDPAVFVYWLEATCADGQTYFTKGNVTVIR